MRLVTREVSPGGWLVVDPQTDPGVGPHTIEVGGHEQPAFVDGRTLMVRCPDLDAGYVPVTVDGVATDRLVKVV